MYCHSTNNRARRWTFILLSDTDDKKVNILHDANPLSSEPQSLPSEISTGNRDGIYSMASHPKPPENSKEGAVHAMVDTDNKSRLLYHIS